MVLELCVDPLDVPLVGVVGLSFTLVVAFCVLVTGVAVVVVVVLSLVLVRIITREMMMMMMMMMNQTYLTVVAAGRAFLPSIMSKYPFDSPLDDVHSSLMTTG